MYFTAIPFVGPVDKRQVPTSTWTQPTQALPPWLSYSTTVIPNPTFGGSSLITVNIVNLPLTYYGPSIPLGTDGNWVYGGLTSPASSPSATSTVITAAPSQTPTFVPTTTASSSGSAPTSPSQSPSASSPTSSGPSSTASSSGTSSSTISSSGSATPTSAPAGRGGISNGAVIAASIAGFVALVLFVIGILLCIREVRNSKKRHIRTPSQESEIRAGQNPEVASLISNRLVAEEEGRPTSPTSMRSHMGPAMRPRTPLSTRKFGTGYSSVATPPGPGSPSSLAVGGREGFGGHHMHETDSSEEVGMKGKGLSPSGMVMDIGSPPPTFGRAFSSQQSVYQNLASPPAVTITQPTPDTPTAHHRYSAILGPLRSFTTPSLRSITPARRADPKKRPARRLGLGALWPPNWWRHSDDSFHALGDEWQQVSTPDMRGAGLHGPHFPAPPSGPPTLASGPPTPFPPTSLGSSHPSARATKVPQTIPERPYSETPYSYYSVSQLAPPEMGGGGVVSLTTPPGSSGDKSKSSKSDQSVYVDASSRPSSPGSTPVPFPEPSHRDMGQREYTGLVSRPTTSGELGPHGMPFVGHLGHPPTRRSTLPEDPAALYPIDSPRSSILYAVQSGSGRGDDDRARREMEHLHAQEAYDALDTPPPTGLLPPGLEFSRFHTNRSRETIPEEDEEEEGSVATGATRPLRIVKGKEKIPDVPQTARLVHTPSGPSVVVDSLDDEPPAPQGSWRNPTRSPSDESYSSPGHRSSPFEYDRERDIVDLDDEYDSDRRMNRPSAPTRPQLNVPFGGFITGSTRHYELPHGGTRNPAGVYVPSSESSPDDMFGPAEPSNESPLDPERPQMSSPVDHSDMPTVRLTSVRPAPPVEDVLPLQVRSRPMSTRRIAPPLPPRPGNGSGRSPTQLRPPVPAPFTQPQASSSLAPPPPPGVPQVRLTEQIPHEYPLRSVYEWFRLNPGADPSLMPTIGIPHGGGPPVVVGRRMEETSSTSEEDSDGSRDGRVGRAR